VADGGSTIDAVDSNRRSVPDPSKLGSEIPSPDIPLWAAAEVSPGRRSGTNARERLDQYDPGAGRSRLQNEAVKQRSLVEQRAVARASSLKPLLTVSEAATILNVSGRTVRRLIASGAIPALSIGRSVRLRPRDVGRLIANGRIFND
jgi:excisionase family DNA binding protein